MDPLILSRIQFGANISFHILFPAITIALGWMLLFFKLRYNATGDTAWMRAYFTWVKVFALSFAMGVVSGVTMSFQFGTNWPGYMETVGNIAGPLLAYEILTAFFLEAAFLGIMLFGFRRVSNRTHTLATVLVAGGTTLSAFWIIALNSWMQTPVGFEMRNGVAHATDWWAIVFNPSMPYRLVHMLLASGLTVSFLIAGLSALRYLYGDRSESMWKALRTGVFTAAILIPIQIFAGDQHGLNTLEHQPQKIAAMEANWNTGPNVPLVLFALPDEAARENKFEVAIPDGASLILRHSASGVVPGLNDFAGNHPPVFPVFWAFRIMVGTGVQMLVVSWSAAFFLKRRHTLPKPLALVMVPMALSGWLATLAGWYTTEIGRQPWLVTGVLKTVDAVGPVAGSQVALSLAVYLILYALLLIAYLGVLVYLALKAAKDGDTSPLPGVLDAALSQPAAK
ncbi:MULTISPECIES: cytochrome ubiquinol oxidase subunit I [unclassified Mesorhizobium]|uniref:cytochrome ubiquinol oxidase subunit I n=1 Tax=unclassified Mesorhizobium TaxID=325217 RepID=UPI000FD4838F|nr:MULTISPECIES: cytochrome ubiquinol oxidase subunit I [unclassified Mesorhizobium]RUV27709.1 cytochrome ubiquinol oxidase subunit I [Mesorhizobium sp. M5C.F.Ca.IN.020.32.2.1]RWG45321.1 MAG: cytochrome ubiquinol oxidase subunit I [Mesorhizobium sp.]RWH49147.1 MAG: cytochrome ubiquinol oxidase subunit I [Mesorhizobium sp.]RWH55613.1 MAG: cytochrome ubiquinol oxidase subunit I [Mesorhizobium sp.]RWI75180.1 MAG: cytochrome ubiquinol oxidase subunit I [Mesorhizobium sp.]